MNASEAIEIVEERSRHITIAIGQQEHKMNTIAISVRKCSSNGDTKQARVLMKRIRMLRDKRLRYIGVREKLWEMKETLEEQSMYVSVAKTFESGTDALSTLLKRVDVTKVEDIMDTFQEQADDVHDVGGALAEPIELGEDAEMAALDDELQIIMHTIEEDMSYNLPSVRSTTPPQSEKITDRKYIAV